MYKIITCEQGSDEWLQARLGKITASNFDKIITKTGKPSSSSAEMVNRAVAELIIGEPQENFENEAMMRGKELEDQALDYFNFVYNYEFKKCGFMDSEKGFGCSPDGIDESIPLGLELKCPLAHTHLSYLAKGELPEKYKQQVQGSLLVSGFDKWIFGSYHPQLPCFRVEVGRDEKYISALKDLLEKASEDIDKTHKKISELVQETGVNL